MAFVEINNQSLHYEDSQNNKTTSKTTLILMHGFLMDLDMFTPITEALQDEFRVVRFDSRGFGKTKWDGKPFSMYAEADDCAELLNTLDIEKAVIGGMSKGGYGALRMALKYPEKVQGLVLMDTRSGTDEEPIKHLYRQTRDLWVHKGPVKDLLEQLSYGIIGSPEDPRTYYYRENYVRKWQEMSGDAIICAMNQMLERDEIDDQLSQIQVPTLVLHGENDNGIPIELGRKLAEDLPNTQFVQTQGGHAAALVYAEEFIPPIQEFLRQFEG